MEQIHLKCKGLFFSTIIFGCGFSYDDLMYIECPISFLNFKNPHWSMRFTRISSELKAPISCTPDTIMVIDMLNSKFVGNTRHIEADAEFKN